LASIAHIHSGTLQAKLTGETMKYQSMT